MATKGTGRASLVTKKGAAQLYSFTSFNFTNAGKSGQNGPTFTDCTINYDYATYPWIINSAYFTVITQGYQLWTAPQTGTYRISVTGASGGAAEGGYSGYGAGAYIQATFSLTAGAKYQLIVGQKGTSTSGGCGYPVGSGGGGSFFVTEAGSLLIAVGGGGGGAYTSSGGNQSATISQIANNGAAGSGQIGGLGGGQGGGASGAVGGGAYTSGCVAGGGGGAGFATAGTSGTATSNGGATYSGGFIGGTGNGVALNGGFGGGGGPSQFLGGGGGGYSGGGGGGIYYCSCTSLGAGGGGGSFLSPFSGGTLITRSSSYNFFYDGSILVELL